MEIICLRVLFEDIKKECGEFRKCCFKNSILVVVFVGYINVGKFFLMNYLFNLYGMNKIEVFEKDMLFVILDMKFKCI